MMIDSVKALLKASPLLPLIVAGTACVADTDELEDLDSTEQASSWSSFADRSINGMSSGASYSDDIGSDAGMSCFLAGVGGNLSHNYQLTTPYAGVFRSNGRWKIQARPGQTDAKIRARALCLNTVAGRTSPVQWVGGAAQTLVSSTGANSNYRCFLSSVSSLVTNYIDLDWSDSEDKVYVFNDGAHWKIGGSGNARGEAYCIRVQAEVGNEFYWHGYTGDLAVNDQNPGTQCFLTGVRGRFRDDSWSNGMFINYDQGLSKFTMTVSGGKGGWARCIK